MVYLPSKHGGKSLNTFAFVDLYWLRLEIHSRPGQLCDFETLLIKICRQCCSGLMPQACAYIVQELWALCPKKAEENAIFGCCSF
jgi:hypothetical protein